MHQSDEKKPTSLENTPSEVSAAKAEEASSHVHASTDAKADADTQSAAVAATNIDSNVTKATNADAKTDLTANAAAAANAHTTAATNAHANAKEDADADAKQAKEVASTNSSAEDEVSSGKDSSKTNSKESERARRRRRRRLGFTRSLQFRITVIFAIVGLITTACMGVMSYMRVYDTTQEFVDEELSQIASVAINYRMIIPRRWEAPRRNHERVLRMMSNGRQITIEYSTSGRPYIREQYYKDGAAADGKNVRPRNDGMGTRGQDDEFLPSISDLHRFKYDIIIAPLFGRPGDALYIPSGANDGFYTLLVADQRVRAFISTNSSGQRFVVARPLSSIDTITKQALMNSIYQFLGINLVFIPLLIISVKMMFITLNKIARLLYRRSEDDLSPIIPDNHKGFVPSELDGFILALNKLFSKVDEGIQSKRRFIADAAHEMRTPLTALSLQAESLEKEDLSPSARAKVERLKEGISRERELMTALLTLAREQNKNTLVHETIDVFELYLKLIDEQEVLADRKFIDLGVEGEAHYKIVTDRMRLTRIMSNLLSNAIKYTPEGGRIDMMAKSLSDGRLELIVQDDGPGIPPEQMEHILEPFYRVHGDRSEQVGTGLGLAIVKASADSINAKLSFKNATPHGLIASVILPPLNDDSNKVVDKERLLLSNVKKR
ncbi:sensor histidine kinase [Anaerobiospirillum succiniciproducens]|uniref:sensor histidine kinase n=1 Tax=Anaerobiospirillum succiniciproducens TaxID=13335 RepID=UPI0023527674|nr:HAMP domain-containing sensor histidine kinase [Anaerobiospirillum succiniciproducens]MCI6863247.1 HAMP domain-containing histidine kinase [Anaerobiospirillum succiniciproducens]